MSQTATRPVGHVTVPFKRIHLELTNVCDFNCAFCPKCVMERPYGYMDADLCRRLMAEIKTENLAEKVTFHVMGEPTLHPDFFSILDHAREIDLPVGLTTNGGSLSGPVGRELVNHPLHQVDVSLQTPDPESFKLRGAKRLTFHQYLDAAVAFFAEYNRRHPDTIFKFRFLNTRFPQKSIEAFQKQPVRVISTTRQLRDTFKLWVDKMYAAAGDRAPDPDVAHARLETLAAHKWNVVEIMPNVFLETYLLADWGHAFGGKLTKIRPAWAGYCDGMRNHTAVLYNGDLVLCCVDFNGRTAFDNVAEKSLREALSGPELGKIMAGFKKYRLVHPYCRHCLGGSNSLSWLTKPILTIGGLDLLRPYFYKHTKLFG
jgi:uncharacterized Fe-S cluster-containing radical SAM superfamily protein